MKNIQKQVPHIEFTREIARRFNHIYGKDVNYEKKAKWISALFGSSALTAITYFVLLKGIKGTIYARQSFELLGDETIESFLANNILNTITISLVLWYFMSFLFIEKLKINITWKGKGIAECAYDSSGKKIIYCSKKYYRPSEVKVTTYDKQNKPVRTNTPTRHHPAEENLFDYEWKESEKIRD